MKMLLKILGGFVLLLVFIVVGVVMGARFSDGPPFAMVAGGAFTTGELHTGPEPDWSFVHDIQEVQFQLLNPGRSRITWIVEVDGRIFIPSGYMTTTWGKLWKQWPIEAEKDGRTILRINGKLYERNLVRLKDGPLVAPVIAEISRKYAGGSEFPNDVVTSGYLWVFELQPRS